MIDKVVTAFRRNPTWVFAAFIVAAIGLFAWYLFTGDSRNPTWVVIGVAALSAFFSAVSAIAALVQASEAQKQREMSERPNVAVYFDTTWAGIAYLVVTNMGNAPAINVKIRFDPGFDLHSGASVNELSLFQNPISFLPPGMTYRQFIDASHKFLEEGKPTYFKAHVEYETVLQETVTESLDFNLEYLRDTHLPDKPVEGHLAEIGKKLGELNKTFQSVKHGGSIWVEAPEEFAQRMQRQRERELAETEGKSSES